jgi:hypothetical protein
MSTPPNFDRLLFGSEERIMRIGNGELGGKAGGLVSIARRLDKTFSGSAGVGDGAGADIGADMGEDVKVEVDIPRMVVLTTEVFSSFMKQNDLYEFVEGEHSDDRIAMAFDRASLPAEIVGDLRALADEVRIPLAIRSSSLLEDAMYHPFAGVYATKMIPNNKPSRDERFAQLREAIKFVYASTFFEGAKQYRRSLKDISQEEKMAVIIQEIVGTRIGDRYYPTLSGVLRSHNFYPTGHAAPEDGICSLALGLGKTIVDGEPSWSFSPAYPKAPPPFNNLGDMMKYTQTRFWSVNMGMNTEYDPLGENEYLSKGDLSDAEFDDTLRFIASTYDLRSDRLLPGVAKKGPRVLDFAPLFYLEDLAFEDLLKDLLKMGEEELGTPVEIEFAMNLDLKRGVPARLGFLQIRPMVVSHEKVSLSEDDLKGDNILVSSEQTLGNGCNEEIRDIVYVKPEEFNPDVTMQIAKDLGKMNEQLLEEETPYLLIGLGRWGTSDPRCGVPVLWGQISGACAIVEAALPDMDAGMSQGSHFFHNVTSFEVFYFSLPGGGDKMINWQWLSHQPEESETRYVRHVRCKEPLRILVDGRSGRGVIRHNG